MFKIIDKLFGGGGETPDEASNTNDEKIVESMLPDSVESDESEEVVLDEGGAEKIGDAVIGIASNLTESLEDDTPTLDEHFFEQVKILLQDYGYAELPEGEDEKIEQQLSSYLEKIAESGNWSAAVTLFEEHECFVNDVVVTFMQAGMPLSAIKGRENIASLSFYCRDMPSGSFSELYEMASESGELEQLKENFAKDPDLRSLIAKKYIAFVEKGEEADEKVKADLETFYKLDSQSLPITLMNGYHHLMPERRYNEGLAFFDEEDNTRSVARRTFDALSEMGLVDEKGVEVMLLDAKSRLLDGIFIDRDFVGGMTERALETGLELKTDDEDVDFWIDESRRRGRFILDDFGGIYTLFGQVDVDVFTDYDLTDERVIRLFAYEMGANKHYSSNWGFYKKLLESGLLESEVFQECLVERIAHMTEIQKRDQAEASERMAVAAVLLRGDYAKELERKGLFDKYPEAKSNKYIEMTLNGTLTEKDRLRLLTHVEEEYFDDDGNLNEKFFNEGSYRWIEVADFLPDEGKKHLFDLCIENGDRNRRILIELGENVWGKYASGALRGYLKENQRCNLEESFLRNVSLDSPMIEKYFDESGAKEEFWRECVRKKNFIFLSGLSSDLLDDMGFDQETQMIIRGMGEGALKDGEEVNSDNILTCLTRFIYMDAYDWEYASESDLKIREAFSESNIKNKDEAMRQLRQIYERYLKAGDGAEKPKSLDYLVDYMHRNDGAGPLTQIEAFLDFCGEVMNADDAEVRQSTLRNEERIKNWDNATRANYYATAAELLRADKRIYQEFMDVFDRIDNERDFKTFAQEILPLYRAKLALLKNYDDYSDGIGGGYQESNYDDVDKDQLLNDLHTALIPFTFMSRGDDESDAAFRERREKGIKLVKDKIFEEISGLFTEKFGILPEVVPAELDKAGMRSVEDMVLYLSNINDQDEDKENVIGYYLALQLDRHPDGTSAWDDFRRGVYCDPHKYLTEGAANYIAARIDYSAKMSPLTPENTGISDDERRRQFVGALQEEVSEISVGNIMTIDKRLQNLCGNIEELADPDLYNTPIEKAKVVIISKYPPKMIGKVATALWMQVSKGREPSFSDEEASLAGELRGLLEREGIEYTADNIQKYLQQGFKELGPTAKTLTLIREKDAHRKVSELQDLLVPKGEVAAVFAELGEEFSPRSGMLALNADLEYLKNLVEKSEKRGSFKGDEAEQARKLELVKEYLGEIEDRMAELDAIYTEIAKSFSSIRTPGESETGAMATKLKEISDIISNSRDGSASVIVSTCSNDMCTIIENMRACLSCKTKGINNDTDLTFGESHKFYLYSKVGAHEKGSISDEIVYFVPIQAGDSRRMGFVMDKVYGTVNSDILKGHISALIKKAKALKAQYPEVPISVLVSSDARSSCSVADDSESFMAFLDGIEGVTIEMGERTIDIPQSGYGDHYIEVGSGSARKHGERGVSGVEIVIN